MKKAMYALVLSLVVVGGLVFANHEMKNESPKSESPKPPTEAERRAAMIQWLATPDGIRFQKWEASPAGKKVYAAEAKIRHCINDATNMEAVVTSLSLPPGSRLGFGIMARINGEDYILTFDAENADALKQLQSLEVDDQIIIRSSNLSHAPKYAYPIISCDYAERDGKVIFKRVPRKGGC